MFHSCPTAQVLKITYFLVKPVLLALSSTAVCNEWKDNHHQKVSPYMKELFPMKEEEVWGQESMNYRGDRMKFSTHSGSLQHELGCSPHQTWVPSLLAGLSSAVQPEGWRQWAEGSLPCPLFEALVVGERSGSDQTQSQSRAAHHESPGKDRPPGSLGWGEGGREEEEGSLGDTSLASRALPRQQPGISMRGREFIHPHLEGVVLDHSKMTFLS